MQSIQPFIDLGYHTVPLNGRTIERDPNGKKKGFSMPSNWQEVHSKTLNELATPIGGLLTGRSGLVALDCDNLDTWELFRSLDPSYTAYFESIGKLDKEGNELQCGTILYQHSDNLPSSKKIKGHYDLDWFNGTGFVFLPTEANHTKTAWIEGDSTSDYLIYNHLKEPVEFKPMPKVVQDVLELIINKPKEEKSVATTAHSTRTKGFLGKILDEFDFIDLDKTGEYEPTITRLLTPKEYRTDLYNKQGHLHPNDVPARHDYQFKIMCILAGDNTVSPDVAREVIYYLNGLWDKPRTHKQLESEIIGGILSGRQKNANGEPYWVYDENWEKLRNWSSIDKSSGALMEIFYDNMKMVHFVYNTESDHIQPFMKKSDVIGHIQASTVGQFDQREVYESMSNVITIVEPKEDFGYLREDKEFNLFKPTKALRILADPSIYEDEYKEPTEFIAYMQHFIPNEQQRNYFLSLLKTKLTSFEYSPVVPYIIGIPGSGKGLLMTILEKIMGTNYVTKELSGSQFINDFNKGWLEHKYIVNLNELAEGLQTKAERTKAIGQLKLYTGSTAFQCHGKGKDVYTAPMNAMFIMTANANPLSIEDADRRVYYISTPNTFNSAPQCMASESSNAVYHAILEQLDSIAYWLATEVTMLSKNDYTTAPFNSGKNELIFSSKTTSEKIGWALKHKEFHLLVEFLINPDPLFKNHGDSKLFLDDLVSVYSEHSSTDDADRILKTVMKTYGFQQKQGYKNAVYWYIDGLKDFDFTSTVPTDDDAEEIRL